MNNLDDAHVKVRGDMIGVHFDSVTELLAYELPGDNPNRRGFKEYLSSTLTKSGNRDGSWIGTTNKCNKDVIDHALLGDPQLYENLQGKIKQFRKAIGIETVNYTQTIKRPKRKRIQSDQGDEVDIHAVYQGRADKAWRSHVREIVEMKYPLVTIMVDIHDVAAYDCTDSFWRAAVAVHLADELQAAGKSVKIVVGGISQNALSSRVSIDGRTINYLCDSIVIKNYNERLVPERLAAMTHLGFFRTFGFGAKSVQPYQLSYGLGVSVDTTQKRFPVHLQEEVDAGHTKIVLIPRVRSLSGAIAAMGNAYKQMKGFSTSE